MGQTVLIILNGVVVLALLPLVYWGLKMLINKLDELIKEVKTLNIKDKEHDLEIKALKVKTDEHGAALKDHDTRIREIKENQLKCKNYESA